MKLVTQHDDLDKEGGAYVRLSATEFAQLTRLVRRGYVVIDEILEDAIINEPAARAQKKFAQGLSLSRPLIDREREVAYHVANGASNPDIMEELGLSEQTVKNYLNGVFNKLGIGGVASRNVVAIWYTMTYGTKPKSRSRLPMLP